MEFTKCQSCGKGNIVNGVCESCGYREEQAVREKRVPRITFFGGRGKFISERQRRWWFWQLRQTGQYNEYYQTSIRRKNIICPECGTENNEANSACSNCGTKLKMAT